MIALVGSSGFVGSNLYAKGKIDRGFHSRNIEEAYGLHPDLLIYAGLRAEKFLANNAPDKDMELIYEAEENIRKISPERLVLISTIDVFKHPVGVNENSDVDCRGLQAYGLNRYRFECWGREHYPDALIIRLPGLYGINMKKNFIYDFINVIPAMLKKDKFLEIATQDDALFGFYDLQDNGFYKCRDLTKEEKTALQKRFKKLGFTALHFTDSRSVYQFYPLDRLWDDMQIVLKNNIRLWHPATEPISAGELYERLTGEEFRNELSGKPSYYDYKTIYAEMFLGKNGYICTKEQIVRDIEKFVRKEN